MHIVFRNALSFVLSFCVAFAFLAPHSSAHSGGTDSSGGHRGQGTDEYHYHHGYPAHKHKDGVCPYDFENLENKITVSGKKTRYDLTDSLYILLDIPSGWIAFSRDTPLDDVYLAASGLSYDEIMHFFRDSNMYLIAYPHTGSPEFSVVAYKSEYGEQLYDLSECSADEVFRYANLLVSDAAKWDTALMSDRKYISTSTTKNIDGVTYYAKQYHTIAYGVSVVFSLLSPNELTASERLRFSDIIRSSEYSIPSISSPENDLELVTLVSDSPSTSEDGGGEEQAVPAFIMWFIAIAGIIAYLIFRFKSELFIKGSFGSTLIFLGAIEPLVWLAVPPIAYMAANRNAGFAIPHVTSVYDFIIATIAGSVVALIGIAINARAKRKEHPNERTG